MEHGLSSLTAWESFYVIVGSSGAALTGLQFVVIALIAESNRQATTREIAAFGTPTIIHFCAVLLVSAILSAPWQSLWSAGLALGGCGIVGIAYGVIIVMRTRQQTTYRPVFEDWLWHAVLPMVAYAQLAVAGFALSIYPQRILFLVGAAALLLLFIGIHNAWDTVTYITINPESSVPRAQGEKQNNTEDQV
jgi:hypothetical protein